MENKPEEKEEKEENHLKETALNRPKPPAAKLPSRRTQRLVLAQDIIANATKKKIVIVIIKAHRVLIAKPREAVVLAASLRVPPQLKSEKEDKRKRITGRRN